MATPLELLKEAKELAAVLAFEETLRRRWMESKRPFDWTEYRIASAKADRLSRRFFLSWVCANGLERFSGSLEEQLEAMMSAVV